MITFEPNWVLVLQIVVAVLLPLLVAIVNKASSSGQVKAVWLAVLTLIATVLTGILNALVTGEPVELFALLLTALGSFAVSVASYFGIWRAENKNGDSVAATLQEKVGVTDGSGS